MLNIGTVVQGSHIVQKGGQNYNFFAYYSSFVGENIEFEISSDSLYHLTLSAV